MASIRMDLNKRCFYVQSGLSNQMGRTLAVEVCRRLAAGSVAVLIDLSAEHIQAVKKDIQLQTANVDVIGCELGDWQHATATWFHELLTTVLATKCAGPDTFEYAFIMHNEGEGSTATLMEPQDTAAWQQYVQENLYSVVALNQQFLRAEQLHGIAKLVVNISASVPVMPLVYERLLCSCQKARDMYFRAMAAEEGRNGVDVLNYGPGIFESHTAANAVVDENQNTVALADLPIEEKLLHQCRVMPIESTLKLINILQEMSFISGHDVDYYDTFVL